jgi:hypothetical protein
MAKDTSFARATPVLTDDVRGVDDPGGTPLTRRFQLTAIKDLLITSYDALYMAIVAPSTAGKILTSNGSAWTSAVPAKIAGDIVQVVHTQSGAEAHGSTVIVVDDSIPTSSEGNALAALDTAITPTSATNILEIEALLYLSSTGANYLDIALFQDAGAAAIATGLNTTPASAYVQPVMLKYKMVAGTTSATTFKVRYGGEAVATITVNGFASGRKMGGVMYSYINVKEIKV